MRRGHSAVLVVLAALAVLTVGLPAAVCRGGGAAGVPDRARRRHHPDHRPPPRHRHRARADRALSGPGRHAQYAGRPRALDALHGAEHPQFRHPRDRLRGPDGSPRGLRGGLHHDGRARRRHGARHQYRRRASGGGGRRPDGQGDEQEGGERRRGLRALDRHRARPQRRVGGARGALVGVGHRARGGEAQGGGPGGRQRARSPRQDRRPRGEDAEGLR